MNAVQDLKISLQSLCLQLVQAGHLLKAQANEVLAKGLNGNKHPAQAVAALNLTDQKNTDEHVTEELIMSMLAEKACL